MKNEDWSLVSDVTVLQQLADSPVGFREALAVTSAATARMASATERRPLSGAALANKKHGRLSVNIQCDGDLNYAPGVLWTAAHHQIPLLSIMHNNRAYHQELMYVEDMAARAQRGSRYGARSAPPSLGSQHRLRDDGQSVRHVQRRAHRQSERSRARHQAGHRRREEGRAGADRRGHPASLRGDGNEDISFTHSHRGASIDPHGRPGRGQCRNRQAHFVKDGCYECHGYAGQGGCGRRAHR